jgi:hypothetical protein
MIIRLRNCLHTCDTLAMSSDDELQGTTTSGADNAYKEALFCQ